MRQLRPKHRVLAAVVLALVVAGVYGWLAAPKLHHATDSSSFSRQPITTQSHTTPAAGRRAGSAQRGPVARPANTPPVAPPSASVPPYSIAEKKDVSLGSATRLAYRVVVSKDASEVQVRAVASDIVDRAKTTRPVNAITILFYYHREQITGPPTVAKVDWAPYGDWSKAKQVNAGDYSSHAYDVTMASPPLEPHKARGISEATRRQIFYDLVAADERAYRAFRDTGDVSRSNALEDSAKATIRKKYGITKKQESEIALEGMSKNWPMPPRSI